MHIINKLYGIKNHDIFDCSIYAVLIIFQIKLKRISDLVFSLLFLILLSPLFLSVSILIKLSSRGEILYKRDLVGLRGKKFQMYKFRTMLENAERFESKIVENNQDSQIFFKVKDDPRITTLGKFLRKYSIDELPQLLNILKGEMSFVGPRPIKEYELELFGNINKIKRNSVKPGLTCFWQVNGRSNISDDLRIKYDIDYVNQWNIILDLKLIIKTVPVVINGDGAV